MNGEVALALDCGTHAVRVLAFDVEHGTATECAYEEIPLLFPQPGWVEVDPEVLASAAIRVVRSALDWADEGGRRAICLGIANMRETAFVWRRGTQRPLHRGIMWMSRQSQPIVDRWAADGTDALIRERTGLTNDAFFFGSKLAWLLDGHAAVGQAAADGELAAGTVDTWLIYRLTGGLEHRTDVSNASRTQVLNLRTRAWDEVLAERLGIPISCLPTVTDSIAHYGVTHTAVCGQEIPISGVIADQQASLLGHGCETRGTAKVTFGTSGVVTLNTGGDAPLIDGLVTSVGWSGGSTPAAYQVEGSAFHSGYTMTWLSERTGHPVRFDVDLNEAQTPVEERVYILPSFSAMGAPRWPKGRGAAITGLAMDTTTADIMRAGLEAMAFQAYDLFVAMGDAAAEVVEVNVDGGGAANDYLCQLLADLVGVDVVRPTQRELTSVGAAKAALRGLGRDVQQYFGQDRHASHRFHPRLDSKYGLDGYRRWVELVEAILT